MHLQSSESTSTPDAGVGKGPNVELSAGVDEECQRRASAEGEEDLVCNVVVRKVTKGTVAVPLNTRMYRVSDLGAVLFDTNENPSQSVGRQQLQKLFDEGETGFDAWVAGHTAKKSGAGGGLFCTLDGLKELACRACVSRPTRRNKIRGSYGALNAKLRALDGIGPSRDDAAACQAGPKRRRGVSLSEKLAAATKATGHKTASPKGTCTSVRNTYTKPQGFIIRPPLLTTNKILLSSGQTAISSRRRRRRRGRRRSIVGVDAARCAVTARFHSR